MESVETKYCLFNRDKKMKFACNGNGLWLELDDCLTQFKTMKSNLSGQFHKINQKSNYGYNECSGTQRGRMSERQRDEDRNEQMKIGEERERDCKVECSISIYLVNFRFSLLLEVFDSLRLPSD